jgi:hypothetical protein
VGLNGRVCECCNSRCVISQRWREKRVIQKVVTQTEFPLIHSYVLPPPTKFLCFFSISSTAFFLITWFITEALQRGHTFALFLGWPNGFCSHPSAKKSECCSSLLNDVRFRPATTARNHRLERYYCSIRFHKNGSFGRCHHFHLYLLFMCSSPLFNSTRDYDLVML